MLVSDCSALAVLDFLSPISLILLQLHNEVNISLDHFQFIRLLQLHTKLMEFFDLIEADKCFFANLNTGHFDTENSNSISPLLFFCNIETVLFFLNKNCN